MTAPEGSARQNGAASVRATVEAVREGRRTPERILEETLSRIRSAEGGPSGLHSFLALTSGEASASAEASAHGRGASPLAGVPVAVKDNLVTLDLPTTCGSRFLEGYRSPFEATAVRRLREAGALVVGKTNLDEFGMGSSTENSAFGPTRNPLDLDRVPGGSSGGSAAAVAAGYVPAALGSDTGGSVRQPAAFCGIVGVKPTYGRVSRYGLVAFASSLDQVGTFGRTVEDAARLLQVVSGFDPRDSTSVRTPVPDFLSGLEGGIEGLVVGVPKEYFPDSLPRSVRDGCEEALERLRAGGAVIREVSLPYTEYAVPTYYVLAPAEASSNLARYDGIRYGNRASGARSLQEVYEASRSQGFGREVKRRILLGTFALSSGYYDRYYGRAQKVRKVIAREFAETFERGVDVLFTPTSPSVAFPLGERLDDPVRMYLSDVFTVTANLAGVPALSLPVGGAEGLPVGGQLLAPKWEEARLLRVARSLERTFGAVEAT